MSQNTWRKELSQKDYLYRTMGVQKEHDAKVARN